MQEASHRENSISIEATLHQALVAHQGGDLAEAERLYGLILAVDARQFDALHLLGLVYLRRGNLEAADGYIQAALTIKSDSAEAQYNCGNVQLALGRYATAVSVYDRALALKPDYADAYCNRGIALFALKRFEDACASYDLAIRHKGDHFLAYSNRGNALYELARYREALASHDQALAINSDYAEAYLNRGNVLMQLLALEEALASYRKMAELRPQSAVAHYNCANALNAFGQHAQAVATYDTAIAFDPNYADAFANRGNALLALGQRNEALASYDRAIALNPGFAEAHYNRGIVFAALGRFEEATASYGSAIAINPSYLEARNNRAAALIELGRHDEALASYQEMTARWPSDPGGHMNEGILRLLMGDFRRGWPKYEWRWRAANSAEPAWSQPAWSGDEDLTGRTILLHGEQGFGDVVQFCRYAPMVAKRAAKVVLEVPSPLKPLVESLGGAQVIGIGEPRPYFDLHCPLLGLPLAFRTEITTVPADVPYLSASKESLDKWRRRLPASGGKRVGIAWAGNPHHKNDHNRSIGVHQMLALLAVPGVDFFGLQKQLRAGDETILRQHPRIVHLGDGMETFADTAAVVSLLDLVISVDTSVAHVAGALARPVWVLLPFAPDWRWLLDRDDSPWYPTARLFRQSRSRDWGDVIDRAALELARFAADG